MFYWENQLMGATRLDNPVEPADKYSRRTSPETGDMISPLRCLMDGQSNCYAVRLIVFTRFLNYEIAKIIIDKWAEAVKRVARVRRKTEENNRIRSGNPQNVN